MSVETGMAHVPSLDESCDLGKRNKSFLKLHTIKLKGFCIAICVETVIQVLQFLKGNITQDIPSFFQHQSVILKINLST